MKCVYFHLEKLNGSPTLDINTTLAVPIDGEKHGCGLFELSGTVVTTDGMKRTPIYLCCDVVEDSNVQGRKMPVLRQLLRNPNGIITNNLNHILWLSLNRPTITNIRLYIADIDGNLASLSSCRLNCALLFIKHHESTDRRQH